MLAYYTTRRGSVFVVDEDRKLAKCLSSKHAVPARRMQWREYDLIEAEVGYPLMILWSDKSGVLQTTAIVEIVLQDNGHLDEN